MYLEKPQFSATRTRRYSKTNGFTLMELLIVIVIIAAIAALGFPAAVKMRKSAQTVACISNVKQVGAAMLMYAVDNNNKLPGLQPLDPTTGKRGDIWPMGLARAGYLWETPGKGKLPCGTGVWTSPSCDFMSDAYGGFGVAEGTVFQYDQMNPEGGTTGGSLRINAIKDPANTWLVGDAAQSARQVKKGWYGIWSNPADWSGSHCPGERHNGKANVCLADGHVESLTIKEIKRRELTQNVVNN